MDFKLTLITQLVTAVFTIITTIIVTRFTMIGSLGLSPKFTSKLKATGERYATIVLDLFIIAVLIVSLYLYMDLFPGRVSASGYSLATRLDVFAISIASSF